MKRLWKYIKDNILYITIWECEISREKRYEIRGKQREYLKLWYKKQTGERLNLDCPKTFTEKQQLLKLYGMTKDKVSCTDKYRVRQYVAEKIGKEYLVPIISVDGKEIYKSPFQINYDALPSKFVIQCNHGAHMTHIISNKNNLSYKDFRKLQKRISKELKIEYAYCHGYEMQYKGIEPLVFLTQYLETNGDLPDYKFFFFNGNFVYMFVDQDRFGNHKRTVFDNNLNIADFQFDSYEKIDFKIDKESVRKMIDLAGVLAKPFDHVRVDFYLCKGKIYFGEMTFSSSSGRKIMKPESSNLLIGDYLNIDGEKLQSNL